jgi:hypothetical protein
MGLEAGLYSKLSGSTAITGIVGTRIFPGHVPQGQSYPAMRFMVSSQEKVHNLANHGPNNIATIQIDCYTSGSYIDVVTLSEKVQALLNTNSTTFGAVLVENSHVTGVLDEPPFQPEDGSDVWIYGRSIDVALHFHAT